MLKKDPGQLCTYALCEETNPKRVAASATIFKELKIYKKEKKTSGEQQKTLEGRLKIKSARLRFHSGLKAYLFASTHI